MYCRNCGTLNEDNVLQCIKCGQVLQPASGGFQPQEKVPSHLALAIFVTICCCVPLGIVGIVYAAQVDGKFKSGDYAGAIDSSKKAALWSWIGFGIGLFVNIIVAIFQFLAIYARAKVSGQY